MGQHYYYLTFLVCTLQAFAFTSMSVVILSTITFVLSTMPELATDLDLILFNSEAGGDPGNGYPVKRWEKVRILFINRGIV